MPNTWVTDMRHFLDESGVLARMPGPALNLATFQGAISAWVTSPAGRVSNRTNVTCRRRPSGRRCLGEIVAELVDGDQTVDWCCPVCGDNGVIRGWQDTQWDRRRVRDA
jgi:hypothetical protein